VKQRWREYHEATKHTVERLMARRHGLDWANMPDPFRHYEGVPLVDLPAGAPVPDAPMLDVLRGIRGAPPAFAGGAALVSTLLFHSAAVSASKRAPSGSRYALRVNPSSGNLHPTEFHFAAGGLADFGDGLYHYRPSSHALELRARGGFAPRILAETLAPWDREAPLVFVLTSIHWREAWKYGARAYRYCCHDMGHAWESLALSARALGLESRAYGHFCDARLARALGLDDEWPMLIVALSNVARDVRQAPAIEWFGGQPNRLSARQADYPLIRQIHAASSLGPPLAPIAQPPPGPRYRIKSPVQSAAHLADVVRARRSALDFTGGSISITRDQLLMLLEAALAPHQADFEGDLRGGDPARLITLYAYVHRVDGVEPGIYKVAPDGLALVQSGDVRVTAAGLSLGQDLAGNSCVTFSMIADLERATAAWGDRGYRYAHFEAGAIGQRLYLAAGAMGFQSSGIGAFYDDSVHRVLGLDPEDGQVIYHFACGYAVRDPRLDAGWDRL
jgi:SagB-type dehydrogenase family enzyme